MSTRPSGRFEPRFGSVRRWRQARRRARSRVAAGAPAQRRRLVRLSGKVAPADQLETCSVRHKDVEYVVTDLSKHDFEEYYNGFANRVLWPILHYRLDLAEFTRRDLSGYFRVNYHFATELEKIIEEDDLIWVHDYHLIPIADALRRRGHANRIGFFLHIPFPPPEILTSLPKHEQLIPLLLQYDIVGFQTEGDAGNFGRYLVSERNHLREMGLFETAGHQITPSLNGRTARIGSFPVGIELHAFRRLARRNVRSPLVKSLVASLGGRDLVIGVDRLDYSKGLIQRLDAFDIFLANHSVRIPMKSPRHSEMMSPGVPT